METETLVLKQVNQSQIGDMIKILSLKYSDVEHRSFEDISKLITKEFVVNCTATDIERYYEVDTNEDFEKEGRIIEYGIPHY